MGAEQAKTGQPQPDLNTALFQLKMASKRFMRESKKAEKEKETNMKKIEQCLKKGDEESARLFAINAQNNINDTKKYLRMACRLDTIGGQLKSNHSMTDVMKGISKNVNPILMNEVNNMDIKEMCINFEQFQANFDKLTVNANIMGDSFDLLSNQGGTQENAENLLNQVKNKVVHNNGAELVAPTTQIQTQPAKTDKNTDFDAFLNDLKN